MMNNPFQAPPQQQVNPFAQAQQNPFKAEPPPDPTLLDSIANFADKYINKPVGGVARGIMMGAIADIGGGVANLATSTGLTPEANEAVKNWEAKVNQAYESEGTNIFTGLGRLLGQGAASAALGGSALGALGAKGAAALGGGKLAQAIGQGAGSFGAWNASTYDPEGAQQQLINGLMGAGVGGVLGGVGSKLASSTVNAAQKLKPMMDYVKSKGDGFPVLSGDYAASSKLKDATNWILDKVPFVGTGSIRAKQAEAYKPFAEQVVKQLTKDIGSKANIAKMDNNQIANLIGSRIKKYSNTLVKDYTAKYNQAFKGTEKQMINLSEFKQGLDKYMTNVLQDDGSKGLESLIKHFKEKVPDMVNPSQLKDIISKPVNQAFATSFNAPYNREAVSGLKLIKQNLMNSLDDAFSKVSPEKVVQYKQAKDAFIFHNKLFGPENAKDVFKAVHDNNSMNMFVNKLLNDAGKIKKAFPITGELPKTAQGEIVASKLQMAINNAYDTATETFSLPKLLNGLKSGAQNLAELDTTKALEGLMKLYGPTYKQAGNQLTQGLNAAAPYIAGAVGAGTFAANPVIGATGLVGASVLGQIAKHSPLQKLLIHAGKIGPNTNPTIVKALLTKANSYLMMAPYQGRQNVVKSKKGKQ